MPKQGRNDTSRRTHDHASSCPLSPFSILRYMWHRAHHPIRVKPRSASLMAGIACKYFYTQTRRERSIVARSSAIQNLYSHENPQKAFVHQSYVFVVIFGPGRES